MKHRIFIAINLPQNIKEELTELILNLQKANPFPDIKWVRPEGLHITLHFLGYLDEEQMERVKGIMESGIRNGVAKRSGAELCAGIKNGVAKRSAAELCAENYELEIKGIDAFPNMNRPRVLFIATKEINNGNLVNLQKKLGQDLEKMGFKIDHRPWQPHITLARIKVPGAEVRSTKDEVRRTKFKIESVDLMESELRRDGARYKIRQKFLISNQILNPNSSKILNPKHQILNKFKIQNSKFKTRHALF